MTAEAMLPIYVPAPRRGASRFEAPCRVESLRRLCAPQRPFTAWLAGGDGPSAGAVLFTNGARAGGVTTAKSISIMQNGDLNPSSL